MLLAGTKVRTMQYLECPGVKGNHSSKIYDSKKSFGDKRSGEHGSLYRLCTKLSWHEVNKLRGN